jgi:hypothetical protein
MEQKTQINQSQNSCLFHFDSRDLILFPVHAVHVVCTCFARAKLYRQICVDATSLPETQGAPVDRPESRPA